jgi:hypothetical protein
MEIIRLHGLLPEGSSLPPVTVRRDKDVFNVITGQKKAKAVLSLLENDAECFDRVTGRMSRAREVYQLLPVGLLG